MTVLEDPWVRSDAEGASDEPFVAILRWPAEAGRRGDVLGAGRRCLWVLGPGELAPELGPAEDWVRAPLSDHELDERARHLARRPLRPVLEPGAVAVDDDGLLRYGGRRVFVSPIEAVICNRLGESPEHVVTRRELRKLIWNDDPRSAAALESRIHTLRCRLAPLDLTIHTIRGRGFLLAATPAPNPLVDRQAPTRSNPWSNS